MSTQIVNGARISELWEAVKDRSIAVRSLTKAEYDVLDEVQKNAEVFYIVKNIDDISLIYRGGRVANSGDIPVRYCTQSEYDAMTEEEKRNGTLYMTPGVPSDSGGAPVPTGAVISFLALSAPSGYLVCDGAEYSVSMYPRLAQYIQEQFGETNHFGGDGEATFAVPDMRNLFLRGYHGESEEQLSGDIGNRQKASSIPNIESGRATNGQLVLYGSVGTNSGEDTIGPKWPDTYVKGIKQFNVIAPNSGWDATYSYKEITLRPVNMAVLYCIKT